MISGWMTGYPEAIGPTRTIRVWFATSVHKDVLKHCVFSLKTLPAIDYVPQLRGKAPDGFRLT
jgi:hypothetical protein